VIGKQTESGPTHWSIGEAISSDARIPTVLWGIVRSPEEHLLGARFLYTETNMGKIYPVRAAKTTAVPNYFTQFLGGDADIQGAEKNGTRKRGILKCLEKARRKGLKNQLKTRQWSTRICNLSVAPFENFGPRDGRLR
jgi:hypothetical protein